jgi:FPC/CPF motif-containing protein YcgG
MRDRIRTRDEALQGSINPMVTDHGLASEARQYAGRAVGEGWHAPFRASGPAPETASNLGAAS